MTTTFVLTLADPVAVQIDTLAGRAGMSASAWLCDQIAHAFTVAEASEPPPGHGKNRNTNRRRSPEALRRRAARYAEMAKEADAAAHRDTLSP